MTARRWLEAFHDGELRGPRRWLADLRLRRDPEARQELEGLARLGSLVREAVDEPAPATPPDVWSAIAPRLAEVDAERRVAPEAEVGPVPRPGWRLAPLAVGAAAAAVAVLLLWRGPEPAPSAGVVRWLDAQGQPVMVLEGAEDATIIWVMSPAEEQVLRRRTRAIS